MAEQRLDLWASDCPAGPDRVPTPGDRMWTIDMPLSDGRRLFLHIGKKGHDAIRDMMAEEARDDAQEGTHEQSN